jgi:hypothetical protein
MTLLQIGHGAILLFCLGLLFASYGIVKAMSRSHVLGVAASLWTLLSIGAGGLGAWLIRAG